MAVDKSVYVVLQLIIVVLIVLTVEKCILHINTINSFDCRGFCRCSITTHYSGINKFHEIGFCLYNTQHIIVILIDSTVEEFVDVALQKHNSKLY